MAKKTAEKSAPGVPFTRGDDPRRGRGPAPGSGGRPPDELRAKCAGIIDKHKLWDWLGRVAAGMPEETVILADGSTRKVPASTKERREAMKLLAAYGFGLPTQVIENRGSVSVVIAGGGLGLAQTRTQ